MQPAVKIGEEETEIKREIDQAIADHGGERQAIGALLAANAYLEAARDKALGLLSSGFVRGQFEALRRGEG